MTYRLTFLKSAKKEWDKLDPSLKKQFSKKIQNVLENPQIQKNKLRTMPDCYKIKLRESGYRLVYRVFEERVVVQVVTVGKRDKNAIYKFAQSRMKK